MFEPIDRVMKMRRGDSAVPRRTQIAGQDHMLSYITPQEAGILQLLGGSGRPGPAGIPAFPPDRGMGSGGDPGFDGSGFDSGYESDYAGGGGGITAADLADDENYDQSLQQDIAMGNFAKQGGDDRGFEYGRNYMGDGRYTAARDSYANARAGLAGLRDFYAGDPFGTDGTGRGLGRGAYDATMGITAKNPYGYEGVFSRRFGIDPRNIDYRSIMSPRARAQTASNQFSKFANPQNIRGRLGFNPAFPDASVTTPGRLRSGLQSGLFPRSFETAYGPTSTYNVKRSPTDTLALLAMPTPLGILADQLSNKTAGFEPSETFNVASQNLGALTGGQATPGFRPADATESGDFSPLGSFGQGISQGIGALENVVGGLFTGVGDFFNTLDPEQGRRARAAAQAQQAQAQAQAPVPKERSVFDNFKRNVLKIAETPEDLFTPAPVSTSSLDFMPRGASPDLAGFESRFAPEPALSPETQQELDAFSMGLPGAQANVSPDLFGVNRVQSRSITPDLRQVATVPAGQFFSENPEALAAIDSDAVRSSVMNPGTRQGFFVDDVTGEISRELPGGSGIRAVVGQIPGMEAPVDFSLPSLSDLTEGIAGIGSAIRGLGSNPFRAEAERRRTTSGNVFRPSN